MLCGAGWIFAFREKEYLLFDGKHVLDAGFSAYIPQSFRFQ
jgi:hypothetical protein